MSNPSHSAYVYIHYHPHTKIYILFKNTSYHQHYNLPFSNHTYFSVGSSHILLSMSSHLDSTSSIQSTGKIPEDGEYLIGNEDLLFGQKDLPDSSSSASSDDGHGTTSGNTT